MQTAQELWLDQLQSATHYNRWIMSHLQPHLRGRVLEVGCGTGNFTELLAPQCSQLVAVDVNSEFVERAIARLRPYPHVALKHADATVEFWEQAFDTILMLDVLEHIEDDEALLRHLHQCLTPEGVLILKVPALSWLYNPLDRAVGHYRRYTQTTLRSALINAAFEDVTLWPFNLAGIPGWWLNGSLLGRETPPGSQVGWFDRCVPFFRAVEARCPVPVGLSLFAVARRSP